MIRFRSDCLFTTDNFVKVPVSALARVVAERARGKGGTGHGNVTNKGGATRCSSSHKRRRQSGGIWQQRFESITNSPNGGMD